MSKSPTIPGYTYGAMTVSRAPISLELSLRERGRLLENQ